VDPDPAGVLAAIADEPGTVLCFASHDRPPLAAKLLHAVGSRVLELVGSPVLLVGPCTELPTAPDGARDAVVAVDGVHDSDRLLDAAVEWARRLHAPVRLVTVYEPVPPDLRDPHHFTRRHGPPGNP